MAEGLRLKITTDPKQWMDATSEWERIVKTAETKAVRDVGILARNRGREAVAAAGFGFRWQKSIVSRMEPKKGISFNPKATILSTINYFDVFETGRHISAEAGKWLWLPLPTVPPAAGRPHMTPRQFIALVGPLVLMWRPGQPPLLGRQMRTSFTSGRVFNRATFRRGRSTARGTYHTIPMFVGVKAVDIPKKYSVKAAVAKAADELPAAYEANLEPYK
jgi:hypothetical protein